MVCNLGHRLTKIRDFIIFKPEMLNSLDKLQIPGSVVIWNLSFWFWKLFEVCILIFVIFVPVRFPGINFTT